MVATLYHQGPTVATKNTSSLRAPTLANPRLGENLLSYIIKELGSISSVHIILCLTFYIRPIGSYVSPLNPQTN